MNNNNSRADQWLQHYEQQQVQEMMTPGNMTSSSGYSLHDGGAAVHEVSGRRSRASRRAIPTTLLNANPSNFRALVQKFTGRSAGGESNRRKSPLTLDFASPATISNEAIFPVSGDRSNYDHDHVLNRHVSNEQRHATWSCAEATTSYQLGEESNSVVDQDHDLLREYSENSSYDDGLDHIDYYHHDFHQETATLEEFMMRDLDL
uniref:VQ domain-containing protein n=1 Tax=Noccaea caerulescens TaxID=107243 RepID=A0A1J3D7Q8_NOCCA